MEITEKAKRQLDNLFHAFSITASGKYVFLTDLKYDYSRWSKQAVEFFGLPAEYMYQVSDVWLSHVHPDDRTDYAKASKRSIRVRKKNISCNTAQRQRTAAISSAPAMGS